MAAKKPRTQTPRRRNPVTRVAGKVNRAVRHRDRKQAVKRGEARHRRRVPDDAE